MRHDGEAVDLRRYRAHYDVTVMAEMPVYLDRHIVTKVSLSSLRSSDAYMR